MQKRHLDKQVYFKEQEYTTLKYVIPFISKSFPVTKDINVLEIGCGEAGNLKPFIDMGCMAMGIDLNAEKVGYARELYASHPNKQNIQLIVDDIYNRVDEYKEMFDLIILRDVIEHIHNQEKFMSGLKNFVKPGGKIFFGFPPWQNPFGGHQQICQSKVLSVTPFFHLLPTPLYKMVLKLFGESTKTVENLVEIKETGISIERFEKILKQENWMIDEKTLFFINPNYEVKFGLKPRKALGFLSELPYFRNFFTTACYYLISKK